MTFNELVVAIMLACGQDRFCQKELMACVVQTTAGKPTDKESNRRVFTHCIQVR